MTRLASLLGTICDGGPSGGGGDAPVGFSGRFTGLKATRCVGSTYLRPSRRRWSPPPTRGCRVWSGAGARAVQACRGVLPTSVLPPVPPVGWPVAGGTGGRKDVHEKGHGFSLDGYTPHILSPAAALSDIVPMGEPESPPGRCRDLQRTGPV